MAESLIQRYLDAGLFDIGDDDDRLKSFQNAADNLATGFAKSPAKIVPAILTAIDPNVPPDEPLLEDAELAVKEHWKAFANKYPERPKVLLRPVILEALAQCAEKDAGSATLIWLSGANLFNHVEQTKESVIISSFLRLCGEKTEAEASKEWSFTALDESFEAPKLTFDLKAVKVTKIESGELQQELQPYRQPHYGGINEGIAKPIADAINEAVAPLYEHSGALNEQLKTPLRDFSKKLGTSISSFSSWINNGIAGLKGKSELLWWKQCLYSPTLQRSYRALSTAGTAIALSEDLNRLCPFVAPQSIEYLLRETLRESLEGNPEISAYELLHAANTETEFAKAMEPMAINAKVQRVCLLEAVRAARTSSPDRQSFPKWLGISADLKLPASEWAVWLFRNAQALTLFTSQQKS